MPGGQADLNQRHQPRRAPVDQDVEGPVRRRAEDRGRVLDHLGDRDGRSVLPPGHRSRAGRRWPRCTLQQHEAWPVPTAGVLG
jgi:hypothetical protein